MIWLLGKGTNTIETIQFQKEMKMLKTLKAVHQNLLKRFEEKVKFANKKLIVHIYLGPPKLI